MPHKPPPLRPAGSKPSPAVGGNGNREETHVPNKPRSIERPPAVTWQQRQAGVPRVVRTGQMEARKKSLSCDAREHDLC